MISTTTSCPSSWMTYLVGSRQASSWQSTFLLHWPWLPFVVQYCCWSWPSIATTDPLVVDLVYPCHPFTFWSFRCLTRVACLGAMVRANRTAHVSDRLFSAWSAAIVDLPPFFGCCTFLGPFFWPPAFFFSEPCTIIWIWVAKAKRETKRSQLLEKSVFFFRFQPQVILLDKCQPLSTQMSIRSALWKESSQSIVINKACWSFNPTDSMSWSSQQGKCQTCTLYSF